MSKVWVWCGLVNDSLEPDTAMLIGKAKELGDSVTAVVIGTKPDGWDSLYGADTVLWCSESGRAWKKGEILTQMLKAELPDIVLFPATSESSQIAAHAAVLLETGLCADCTELRIDNDQFIMHRPAFGGGVEADIICPEHRPQMATVRSGIFSDTYSNNTIPEYVEFHPSTILQDPITLISSLSLPVSQNLQSAEIIVAGGLGVGSKEGFALLQKLADAIGAQVGATRAAVDAGFIPWKQQIGQTGLMVHPKLYLAFGISGAIQHIAGMHGSGCIISVNTDPRAPIFSYSDYAIIGDWKEVAEKLIQRFS